MNNNLNQKDRIAQNKAILSYLRGGNKLTQLLALEMFGCMRLPSRIHDLKKAGIEIKDRFITLTSGKRVKEYWI